MKGSIFTVLIALTLPVFAQIKQQAPGGFPEFHKDGVNLAQIFDTKVSEPDQYIAHPAKVYYIWGASKPVQPTGVIASKYFPSMRTPDKKLSLEWYQQNHPDWVMYQEDRKTPAYGYVYSYGGLTPLDISNPEVQEFYLNTFILPEIKNGYSMVAMDNVDLSNWPKSAGHYSGDKWVQLYTGKKNDPLFHQNIINWMQFLTGKLHALGVRVSANIKATTAPEDVILKVINTVDMWVDETGFCHRGENITDEAWERAFLFLRKVTPFKAYAGINQVKGTVNEAPHQQIEWVIANYLLARGPESLLAVCGYDKSTLYQYFAYRPEMDVNIGKPEEDPYKTANGGWCRKYSNGLIFINPSSKNSAIFKLPAGKWKTLSGSIVENELTLMPASGAVLTVNN